MALFGKTYSDEDKKEMNEDIDGQIERYMTRTGSVKGAISDAITNPNREGALGRGGKLRNEIIGLRKKKTNKSKTKRKTKKCKCK